MDKNKPFLPLLLGIPGFSIFDAFTGLGGRPKPNSTFNFRNRSQAKKRKDLRRMSHKQRKRYLK